VALSSPAAARRCNAWQWLVVAFSAKQKQKQQLHQQQLTNGSTILFTFTFPVNLDLLNLSTVSFGSITLAARGLEEPRNSQELLTEFVDLTKFVGPLPFSA